MPAWRMGLPRPDPSIPPEREGRQGRGEGCGQWSGDTQKSLRSHLSHSTTPLTLPSAKPKSPTPQVSHLSSCCRKDPYLAHRTCAPSCQRYSYWAGTQGLESWNSASGMWGHFHQERHPGFQLSCSCSRVRKTNETPNRPIHHLSQETQVSLAGQEEAGTILGLHKSYPDTLQVLSCSWALPHAW